eukprot:scaffold1218_cov393-Prasinococcus_capsulatus_cf.AAC.4
MLPQTASTYLVAAVLVRLQVRLLFKNRGRPVQAVGDQVLVNNTQQLASMVRDWGGGTDGRAFYDVHGRRRRLVHHHVDVIAAIWNPTGPPQTHRKVGCLTSRAIHLRPAELCSCYELHGLRREEGVPRSMRIASLHHNRRIRTTGSTASPGVDWLPC